MLNSNRFKSIISLSTHRYSCSNACQVANSKVVTNYSKNVNSLAKSCWFGCIKQSVTAELPQRVFGAAQSLYSR